MEAGTITHSNCRPSRPGNVGQTVGQRYWQSPQRNGKLGTDRPLDQVIGHLLVAGGPLPVLEMIYL